MDLLSKNEAYKNYLNQAKEAYEQGDKKRAKHLFLEAAKITNEISLNSTNVDIKNEYYQVSKTILDFVKTQCATEVKTPAVVGAKPASETKVVKQEVENISLEESLEKLNSLIGLEGVKETISDWVRQIQVFQKRKSMGLKVPEMSYHMVFTGNPGTGKTTVARIVAQIYRALGIVSKGHLVEVDRSKLVSPYVGKTAGLTNEKVDEALGGVMFIDEAYGLIQGGESDFGPEAITALLKRMEDDRDDLAVIVAGYDDLMQKFFDSNPGLASRFKTFIKFRDYEPDELMSIFLSLCEQNDYVVSDELREYLSKYFHDIYFDRDKHFGNGRDVRNLFEKAITRQSKRIYSMNKPTVGDMMLLLIEDIHH